MVVVGRVPATAAAWMRSRSGSVSSIARPHQALRTSFSS